MCVFEASSLGHSPFWTKVVLSECISLRGPNQSDGFYFLLQGGYVRYICSKKTDRVHVYTVHHIYCVRLSNFVQMVKE